MSGQLTVTLATLSGGGKKILSTHAVVEEGKRRATGGCQLREREGHHLLRGEQHECLRLPGLHGAQPRRQEEELKALQHAAAWRVNAPGPERESVLHQTRSAKASHAVCCIVRAVIPQI